MLNKNEIQNQGRYYRSFCNRKTKKSLIFSGFDILNLEYMLQDHYKSSPWHLIRQEFKSSAIPGLTGNCLATCIVFLLSFFLFKPALSFAQTQPQWEFFEINAQYRGTVKKGFEDLGCAIAFFKQIGQNERQVIFHACIRHPENQGKFFSVRINLVHSINENRFASLKEIYSWSEGFDKSHLVHISDLIIFLSAISMENHSEKFSDTIEINGSEVSISGNAQQPGKRRELLVRRAGKPPLEGKFFYSSDNKLEKFRFRRDKVVISFVVTPMEIMQSKYQHVSPWREVVFGK